MNKGISVIIVNFQGEQFIEHCIASVEKTLKGLVHEIIVVDNASTDGSVEILRDYAVVRLFENTSNVGFGKAVNQAVEHANYSWLLLLNNDACMTSFDAELLETLEDRGASVAGGKVSTSTGQRIRTISNERSPLRMALSWLPARRKRFMYHGSDEYYKTDKDGLSRVDRLSGAFLLVSREMFVEVGGFDARFFMYAEDADYCKRVELAGGNIYYTDRMAARHDRWGGKEWIGTSSLIYSLRSNRKYLTKWHGRLVSMVTMAVIRGLLAARSVFYLLRYIARRKRLDLDKARGYAKASIRA